MRPSIHAAQRCAKPNVPDSLLRAAQAPLPAVRMSAAEGEIVPDMQRRTIMNLVLLGGAGVPVLWLAGGFIYFLVPPGGGGGGAGLVAKDALGNDVPKHARLRDT